MTSSITRWSLARSAPGAIGTPEGLVSADLQWIDAEVPGTVASAMRAAGLWSIDDNVDFDTDDWWYRTTVLMEGRSQISFGGLATIADVWVDGHHVLHSENMFVRHLIEVGDAGHHDIVVRCAALAPALLPKRPRPRWKTRLVQSQNLRWFRTTLLNRMPGWSPPAAPVGIWREVTSESADAAARIRLSPTLADDLPTLTVTGPLADGTQVHCSGRSAVFAGGTATLSLPDALRWWPHTHGEPHRYAVTLDEDAGSRVLGHVGFRSIHVDRSDDGFAFVVNGSQVFVRGGCWTPLDIVSLQNDPSELRHMLSLVRDAGMNMIRVGGTMVYETDEFYDLCDAYGILVWHDFMFANMDYPIDDLEFAGSVEIEARQFVGRVGWRPSTAIFCGGSEIEQQAAMMGVPAPEWTGDLLAKVLPAICADVAPDVPFVTSSPSGGAMPFHANAGVTHYYGVGAYLRPLSDARLANVRFAAECLAFANVPEPSAVDSLLGWGQRPYHHPRWKRRVPRDSGAGWDFEDVRDHYVTQLFGEDALAIRYADPERYLDLGRMATMLVMQSAFAEWRRPGSSCSGALVFLLRDLWPGAGWGVVDSDGQPKSAYYGLKRVMQPVTLLAIDEGLNGLYLHVVNDRPEPFSGSVEMRLYHDDSHLSESVSIAVLVDARSSTTIHADAELRGFRDLTWSYRFGPASYQSIVSVLRGDDDTVIAQTLTLPTGRQPSSVVPVTATIIGSSGEQLDVRLDSDALVVGVALGTGRSEVSDAYVTVAPGVPVTISVLIDDDHPLPASLALRSAVSGWSGRTATAP